jgi:hypothetical protein
MLAMRRFPNVAGHSNHLAAGLGDEPHRLLRIRIGIQIGDRDIRSFTGKRQG